MGAVTGNRWWVSLKYRIRNFATKYGQQLNLDKAKEAKFIDDRHSQAAAGRDSRGVELARRDLERESSECYKGHVVRSRLNRVLYEAVKSNATAREEEVRRFPDRYIASVKTADGRLLRSSREMRDAFRAHFRDRFARCPDLPIREFRSYLDDFPRLYRRGDVRATKRGIFPLFFAFVYISGFFSHPHRMNSFVKNHNL